MSRMQTASPRTSLDFAATLQDRRERRRREVGRELLSCFEEPANASAEEPPRAAAVSSCPARPPKPKPHTPLSFGGEAAPLPTSRRWRSALVSVWPDRRVTVETSKPDVERSIAAATIDLAPGDIGRQDADPVKRCTAALPEIERVTGQRLCRELAAAGAACAAGECTHRTHSDPKMPDTVELEGITQAAVPTERLTMPPSRERTEGRTSGDERPTCDGSGLGAAAAALAARDLDGQLSAERVSRLASGAQRLRDKAARLRSSNRYSPTSIAADSTAMSSTCEGAQSAPSIASESAESARMCPCSLGILQSPPRCSSECSQSRADAVRRRLAELDEVSALERKRLEQERRAVEARRREQEAFERSVREQVDRDMRHHREQAAQDLVQQALREKEVQREREERDQRRKEQQEHEELQSKRLGDRCREARSDAAVARWKQIEEAVDRQWAEQEAEERRRVEEYASSRRKQFQEWDRQLTSERRTFASEAEFRDAAAFQKVRNAAHADEVFYGTRCGRHTSAGGPRRTAHEHQEPMHDCTSRQAMPGTPAARLSPEEQQVLKEMHVMRSAPLEAQKAKIKEMLLRWHPDKNPACADKATHMFQFVQRQREAMLCV